MRRGFTLIEVLLAALLLGVGLSTILVSMSQAQKLMLVSVGSETSHEVMDWGEMAYPLEEVTDIDDIDIEETKAEELWAMISEERLTNEQEEKFYGYTWMRERVDENMDSDEIARLGGIVPVRITVKWADNRRGDHQEESYITFWRQPAE
ncbi:MAG: prepilin-type N-terminal cleavage/methylation domain-containing protein [Kiritimatiellae bacterium]|nr:prepilin-type N-terminal cleavage/methylation domain-containing protein [Kiritimatiellia bacterium]